MGSNDPDSISSIVAELERAGVPTPDAAFGEKRNFAQRLSDELAQRVANELRRYFVGILPDEYGKFRESRARTGKGYKKLDINYSTTELGLGLGVSIKTFSFRDTGSSRCTKNYTARDNELRAEAEDYHERQPYAVMIGLIFLPADSCHDGEKSDWSSFAQAIEVFRWRAGRRRPTDKASLFERIYIGVYEAAEPNRGELWFYDVEAVPPRRGVPNEESRLKIDSLVQAIRENYDERNGVGRRKKPASKSAS